MGAARITTQFFVWLWWMTCTCEERKLLRGEREVGRDCCKQKSHGRKLGVQSTVAVHWLSCDSLLLAELLQSKKKIFLLMILATHSSTLSGKAMATHSCTLTWQIPWTEEPSGLQAMGSWGVGHNFTFTFTFTFHFHALEKEMATHSNALAWRIPGTGEPDGLPSMGSHRVRHDWRDLAAAAVSLPAGRAKYTSSSSSLDLYWPLVLYAWELPLWPPDYFSEVFFFINFHKLSSVTQSCLTLWPHGLQHARLPCLSPTPGIYSNSCPLSWRCHPTLSSSVIPFSSHRQSFPASGSFPVSQFFTSGGQSTGASTSASVLPMNIQDWFPLGLTGLISL